MYKVYVTPDAKDSLKNIKEYILEKFTYKEYSKLVKEIDKIVKLIQKGNLKFKYSSKTEIQKVVLHKNSSMYYRIKNDTIEILFFWNNRMMEGKHKYE